MRTRTVALVTALLSVAVGPASGSPANPMAGEPVIDGQSAPSMFRAGVNLLLIDVQVTPEKDAPLRAFAAVDFEVSISGRKRPVTSISFLHDDTGPATRASGAPSTSPDCVFDFKRKKDRATAHYLIGVERVDADQKQVKDVRVEIVDKAFSTMRYAWRSPIRRVATIS